MLTECKQQLSFAGCDVTRLWSRLKPIFLSLKMFLSETSSALFWFSLKTDCKQRWEMSRNAAMYRETKTPALFLNESLTIMKSNNVNKPQTDMCIGFLNTDTGKYRWQYSCLSDLQACMLNNATSDQVQSDSHISVRETVRQCISSVPVLQRVSEQNNLINSS